MKSSTAIVAAALLTVAAAQSKPANPAENWCQVYVNNCKLLSNETCIDDNGQFNSSGNCKVGFSDKGCASFQINCRCSIINGPPKDISIDVLRKTFDDTNGTCKNLGEGTNVTSPANPSVTATVTAPVTSTPVAPTSSSTEQTPTTTPSSASTALFSLTAATVVSAIMSALFL